MSTMHTVDADLVSMMTAVFADHRRKAGPWTGGIDLDLWADLDRLGLIRLTGAASSGGSGGSWFDAAALLTAATRHGIHLPMGEHDLLAEWLREEVQLGGERAIRTAAVLDERGRGRAVPWAGVVDRLVLVWPAGSGYRIGEVSPGAVALIPGVNRIGEPRDTVLLDTSNVAGVPVDTALVHQFRLKSAMLRAIQVCAALDRALDLSVEHARTRSQFGRPIASFQMVQAMLADMAGECALARAATEAALISAVRSGWSESASRFRVAAARSCAGHAASVVVRNAHQVHGAIGTTREHQLHESTRAALAWRSEFGSMTHWDREVMRASLAAGADGLWTLITR